MMARGFLAAAALALALPTAWAQQPSVSDQLAARANERMQRGDLRGAIADLNQAIARDAQNSPALALRGTLRMMAGEHRGALADLTRAAELTPDVKGIEVVFANRANVHRLLGDTGAAHADVVRALARNGDFGLAYNVRARLKADAGDLDGALADYDRAIRLEPKLLPAYAGRAAANLQAGRLQESISDYKTLMWSSPGDADAVASHGILRGLLGETEAAVNDLLRARRMDPRSVSDASRAPAISPAQGLEQYLQMHPQDARAYLMQGLVGLLNAKADSAELDLARAVQLDPALAADAELIRSRR